MSIGAQPIVQGAKYSGQVCAIDNQVKMNSGIRRFNEPLSELISGLLDVLGFLTEGTT